MCWPILISFLKKFLRLLKYLIIFDIDIDIIYYLIRIAWWNFFQDRRSRFKLSKLFEAFRARNRRESRRDSSESNGSSDAEDYIDVGHRPFGDNSLAMGKKSVSEHCLPAIGSFATGKKVQMIMTKTAFGPNLYSMPTERKNEMQQIQRPQLQIRTVAELNAEVKKAKSSGNYEALVTFFADVFHSLEDVATAFSAVDETDIDCDKTNKCKSKLNLQLVDAVYAHLLDLVQKKFSIPFLIQISFFLFSPTNCKRRR